MIKNLLFDLGGVIMDIRRENCVAAFEALGMKDADDYLGVYAQKGPFEGIENGSYSVDDFHNEIRRIIGDPSLTDVVIDESFQKFLIGIPEHRLRALEHLHEHYGMYLLSNTNPIMWQDMIRREFEKDGHDVNYYFDGCVTSFEAGVMKPDRRIFDIVLEKFDIKAEETLFFDDSAANTAAARKLGFKTITVTPGTEFEQLIKQYPQGE